MRDLRERGLMYDLDQIGDKLLSAEREVMGESFNP
jgi:hypothetical protein